LNDSTTAILHLKNKKITKYSGNFDTFLDTYALKQKNAEEHNAKIEAKRRHMMAFVERFGVKATKARQAQSRLKAISKMKFLPIDQDDPTVVFNFPEANPALSSNILSYDKISLSYGDKIVLKNISGTVMSDDRIAIVGANGNGKTTFAKFLAGELQQKKGTRDAHNKLKIGFYRQDLFEKLDVTKSPYDFLKEIMPNALDKQIRSHLGRFGFSGDKVFQLIKELSGGERARLVFATLTLEAPNLLILDEPTNHLDMEMRESLVSALTSYGGAVILITHDRNFLNRVANSIFIVANGSIKQFNGDLSQYEKAIQSERQWLK
jgi:ATP-binding cassette subfamily F protein 3